MFERARRSHSTKRVVGVTGRRVEPVHVDDQFGNDAQVLAPLAGCSSIAADGRTRAPAIERIDGTASDGEDVDERGSPGADIAFERLDDRRDQRFTIAEVVLHCVGVAMAGGTNDLTQRDGIDALLGEELPSCFDQCVPSTRPFPFHGRT